MTEPLTGAPWTTEPGAIVFLPETEETGFTEDEAYAFLSGGVEAVTALQASQVPAVLAAADVHDGAMVAFVPTRDDLIDLVLLDPAAEPLDQLHITAAYLGSAADVDEETRTLIIDEMRKLAANQPLIVARVFGFAVLNPDGPEPCLVANVGGFDLEDAHASVIETLTDIGLDMSTQHEPWLAHITLAYDPDPRRLMTDDLMTRTGNIGIDIIRIAFGGEVTDVPLGVYESLAADSFHLAGKHDQKAHGRGGIATHASPGELEAGRKLSKGKKIGGTPEEDQLRGSIESFTREERNRGSVIGEGMRDPEGDTPGAQFVRTVAAAPEGSPTLHRGTYNMNEVPQEGDVFDLGPSSFSRSEKVATKFAHGGGSDGVFGGYGGENMTIIHLKKGSRSLRVDQHSAFPKEEEHITMGRFRVTRRRDSVTEVTTPGGKKIRVPVHEIDIEQVNPDDVAIVKQSKAPAAETPSSASGWDVGGW